MDPQEAAATRSAEAVSDYYSARQTWSALQPKAASPAMQLDDPAASYSTVTAAQATAREALVDEFRTAAAAESNATQTDPAKDPYQAMAEQMAAREVPASEKDDYLALINEARAEAIAAQPTTLAEARSQTLTHIGDLDQVDKAIIGLVVLQKILYGVAVSAVQ